MQRVKESYEVSGGIVVNIVNNASAGRMPLSSKPASSVVQIHTGCPWIRSRPVYVLIQQHPNSDAPLTYTLRTKVNWAAAENELSKVTHLAFRSKALTDMPACVTNYS